MTSIPEYCVKLHAPSSIINKYMKFFLCSLLFQREVDLPKGYACELFEGGPLYVPNDPDIASYIDLTLVEMQACSQDIKAYSVTMYIYKKENLELVERWVFDVNTEYDLTHPLPTLGDLMGRITEKLDALPSLTESCFFSIMMQESLESCDDSDDEKNPA